MYILIISRGIPTQRDPQWGCFEKDQAEALAGLGHKVVVASVDSRFRFNARSFGITHQTINGIEYYNSCIIPGAITNLFGYAFNLKIKMVQFSRIFHQIMKKHGKPDILFGQFFFNTVLGTEISKKYQIPLVGIEHAGRFNDNTLSSKTRYEASIAYQQAHTVLAVSSNLKEALKKHFHINPIIVYNTYGKEFSFAPHRFDHTFHLVATGSLLYEKGFDLLITALAQLETQVSNFELRIIGEGKDRQRLEKMIKDYQLQDKIHLIGRRNKTEIASILQSSDCFILPSRGENFSVAVLEALACGCPVISSDCGDIKACINQNNGLLFPIEDTASLKEQLLYFFAHHKQYDRKAIAEDCKAKFSSEVIAKQLTKIFEEVTK